MDTFGIIESLIYKKDSKISKKIQDLSKNIIQDLQRQIIRTDTPEDNPHTVISIITELYADYLHIIVKLFLFFSIFLYLN